MEDNGEDKDEAKRRTRNLSEKKRRDQFILLINELSTMVSTNSRKMDKCTVLKATISFLRNHNEITVRSRAHNIREEWKPTFLSNEEFTYLVLEALEGFVMVISTSGPIYYVSESITTLLGYDPVDILNKNIFEMIYEEEHGNMYNILHNGPTIDQAQEREGEISFQCHFKRAREIGDLTTDVIFYELIQFNGRFRPIIEQVRSDDSQSYQNREAGKLFVCTGRLCTPQLIKDVSLVDTNRNEFTSRHSLEWKFLFLDHRAPPIIGYLPFEVLGTSGYDYYHFDDLEKVTRCHELLMTKGDITSCYYRFLTKGQQWIWLQSRFYISYHQWNSKPEFVVCTHRVVSHADIEQSMKQENDVERPPHLNNQGLMKEDTNEETLSNQYIADRSTYANTYCDVLQGCSRKLTSSADSTVETIATTGSSATSRSWPRFRLQYKTPDSDTASTSSDIYPVRNTSHQMHNEMEGASGATSVITYVEPSPCVPVTTLLALPIHPLPVIVTSDQAQVQLNVQKAAPAACDGSDEQLHRKHEELEQMIVQQQEELRQVKEQLLLARLGILQPFINVQNLYVNQDEMQQSQRLQPPNMVYEPATTRQEEQYMPPHQPSEHNTQHQDHVD